MCVVAWSCGRVIALLRCLDIDRLASCRPHMSRKIAMLVRCSYAGDAPDIRKSSGWEGQLAFLNVWRTSETTSTPMGRRSRRRRHRRAFSPARNSYADSLVNSYRIMFTGSVGTRDSSFPWKDRRLRGVRRNTRYHSTFVIIYPATKSRSSWTN